ncbi:MAG: hypothetical protein IJN74_00905 [Clostridia bacterium]|nr:hypothetical protein [Clostridia bacterium]
MKKSKLWIGLFLGVIFLLIFVLVLPFLIRDNFANIQKLGITLKYHEMLSYLITSLSVIVTAILSCITVFISKKASMVSDRMLSLEEEKLSPYLDIVREKSYVSECKNSDELLKVKLYVRNIGQYPIQNILLSRKELDIKEIEDIYVNDKICDRIFAQLSKLNENKENKEYTLTCIAGLREMTVVHSRYRNGEREIKEEELPFSESLYFNIEKDAIEKPIEIYITMQNISGEIYVQKTKLYISTRSNKHDYFLTMHSKTIKRVIN